MATVSQVEATRVARHSLVVRITHWVTFACFLALLITGVEILISHPRFYWGETGNVNMRPLFSFPIPSSRGTVPTGYGYVMPDQNGWSRYLHFEAAWVLLLAGAAYLIAGVWSGHLRRDLVPSPGQRHWRAFWLRISLYLHRVVPAEDETRHYNVLQRSAYLSVLFGLMPLLLWTGLAMSPGFTAAFPHSVSLLGGRQSARTLHLFATAALVLFVVVHVLMVATSGFRGRMWAMITGRAAAPGERV